MDFEKIRTNGILVAMFAALIGMMVLIGAIIINPQTSKTDTRPRLGGGWCLETFSDGTRMPVICEPDMPRR